MIRAGLRWLARGVALCAALIAALFLFGRPENDDTSASFSGDLTDPVAYLAAEEAKVTGIREGLAKQIVWAGQAGAKTPLSVVYLHGFVGSAGDLAPVPQDIAKALGANLFLTRFTGHAMPGEALADVTVPDWTLDLAEAIAVGEAIGDKVLVLSFSTGGSFAALAATRPDLSENLKGVVFFAPNFGINNPLRPLLTWPEARIWLPPLAGRERSGLPRAPRDEWAFTRRYPSTAVLPVAAISEKMFASDLSVATAPALFIFSEADQVVLPARTHDVMGRWGGSVTHIEAPCGPGVNEGCHVLMGDVLSPANNEFMVSKVIQWMRTVE